MSVVFIIVLWGVFFDGDKPVVRDIRPECGETHCTITVDEAQAILRAQSLAAHGYERLKKSCSQRGSDT